MSDKKKIWKILLLVLFFLCIGASIGNAIQRQVKVKSLTRPIYPLSEWQFTAVDGMTQEEIRDILEGKAEVNWISYRAPGVPLLDSQVEHFVARTKLPATVADDPSLLLEIYDHLYEVYQNGQIIYQFGVENGEFKGDVLGNHVAFVHLSDGAEGQWIYLNAQSLLADNTGYIKEASFASFSQNILTVALEGFSRIVVAALLVVAGLVYMLFYKSRETISFLHVGFLSVLIGLWFFFDSNRSLALLGINPLLAQYLGLYAMYLAPLSLGVFLLGAFNDKSLSRKLIQILIGVQLAYIFAASFVDFMFGIRLPQTLFIFHILLVFWVVLCGIRVGYCWVKKMQGAKVIALAFIVLAVTVLVEMLGLQFHIAVLQLGYVSYAMIAFVGILGCLPIQRVAALNRQVQEYSEELTHNSQVLEKIILGVPCVLEHQSKPPFLEETLHQALSLLQVYMPQQKLDYGVWYWQGEQWDLLLQGGNCDGVDKVQLDAGGHKDGIIFTPDGFSFVFSTGNVLEGIIQVQNTGPLSDNITRYLKIFSSLIHSAYYSLSLNREVITSQENIIYALGNITENRSSHTGQHIRRVAEYSKYLAQKLGMDEKEVEVVKIASAMHDIGKLGIPDSILNKPGKLTEEEFSVMKQHAQIGYEVLAGSSGDIIHASAIIALQHHEKYNGLGYAGIAGNDIHLYARIVSIADVFDALLNERPYKKPWTIEDTIAYFKNEAGQHFDPQLVDLFLDGINEFMEIRHNFPDEQEPVAASPF